MDIQMPVMNGYDAALAIRDLENGGRIPIVALTAGTVKGEKEKCLAAGMDDYVTKPIVRDTVIHVIGKWINAGIEPIEPVSNTIRVAGDLHFNAENLKNFVSDEPGFMEKILSMSKTNLNNTLLDLEESIKSQDIESIRSVAHKMKGTALSACFDILARQLGQLESIDIFKQSEVIISIAEIKEELEYLNTHCNL